MKLFLKLFLTLAIATLAVANGFFWAEIFVTVGDSTRFGGVTARALTGVFLGSALLFILGLLLLQIGEVITVLVRWIAK